MAKKLFGWVKLNGIYQQQSDIHLFSWKEVFNSLGSTFNRGDFTNGNAFFWSSLDLSPYRGTDLGSTPYYIELVDAVGKKATGYLGAVGAGETLGSELVDEWTNNTTYPFETFTPGAGNSITQAVNSSGLGFATKSILAIYGQLYKEVATVMVASGTTPDLGWYTNWSDPVITLATGSTAGYYLTAIAPYNILTLGGDYLTDFSLSGFSLKRVTDPPTTTVHIVSSLNGITRDWALIESGFDPNMIASWKIYG